MHGLSLYHFFARPFCTITRGAIYKLNLNFEARDINKKTEYRQPLEIDVDRVKVLCLRTEESGDVRWMYE